VQPSTRSRLLLLFVIVERRWPIPPAHGGLTDHGPTSGRCCGPFPPLRGRLFADRLLPARRLRALEDCLSSSVPGLAGCWRLLSGASIVVGQLSFGTSEKYTAWFCARIFKSTMSILHNLEEQWKGRADSYHWWGVCYVKRRLLAGVCNTLRVTV
jgi:hypothetical protein